jgi:hypothetical protein
VLLDGHAVGGRGPSFRPGGRVPCGVSGGVDSATALRSARNDRNSVSSLLESFPCRFRVISWLLFRNRSHCGRQWRRMR